MLMLVGVDVAAPFVWAGAAACVAAVVWVLSTATRAGIAEVVRPLVEAGTTELRPLIDSLHLRVSEHLDTEEAMLQGIDNRLRVIEESKNRNSEEIARIWRAIDELHRRR